MQFIPISLLLSGSLAAATPTLLSSRGFSFSLPASKGSVTFSSARSVSGSFDGGMKTYGRGVACTGQQEGGNGDAVFLLQDGATLSNAIIGADQIEGVHCLGACTLRNVWWAAVCEDALTLKGDGDASVVGGGARGAEDKVVQHNGIGHVTIDGFSVSDFGKLYRSCGNCKNNGKARQVTVKNVRASNGKVLVGINRNYGDTATIDAGTCASGVKQICSEYQGNGSGAEPPEVHSGPSGQCKYSSVKAC